MNTIGVIILITFVLAAIALAFVRKYNREHTSAEYKNLNRVRSVVSKAAYKTAGGRDVFTSLSLDPKMLTCIDLAWNLKDSALAANGYGADDFPSSKSAVVVLPSVRDVDANGVYSPGFQTWISDTDGYFNGGYDKMAGQKQSFWQKFLSIQNTHYILAAEWVIDPAQNIIAVAEYKRDWTNCRNAVFHGDEHCVLFRKDIEKYYLTADHSQGGGHPILNCPEYNEQVVL